MTGKPVRYGVRFTARRWTFWPPNWPLGRVTETWARDGATPHDAVGMRDRLLAEGALHAVVVSDGGVAG